MKLKKRPRMGRGKLVTIIVSVISSLFVASAVHNLSLFYGHLHRFSFHIENQDRESADTELVHLKTYYNYFTDWGLSRFADYLLDDMFLYEAELDIINENYEEAIQALEYYNDDPRALYLSGVARYRALHAAYQAAKSESNGEEMQNIVKMVMEEAGPYFQRCVEASSDIDTDPNCRYNYDLTSDENSTRKALNGVKPGSQYILSLTGSPSDEPGQKEPLDLNLDDPMATENDNKKKS